MLFPARHDTIHRTCARQSGLTLLELLVVIAIFAIMSTAAYDGLQASLKAEENFHLAMRDLEAVQMSMSLFQQDIMQISPRPVRDAYGDEVPAVVLFDGRELVFTRSGNFSSLKMEQADLLRVAYSMQGEQLLRAYWLRLDSTQGDQPLATPLLDNVNDMQIRILDQDGIWHLDWPLSESGRIRAVELTLDLEGWGEIRRLLQLPG
ncbi:MAG: type II secretion system minor pseudopilin GspJ [Xanthomonadales bacterium]|nr:type II secretion system minor pseudopilin GspJ [Xanthomonadales bacterium]